MRQAWVMKLKPGNEAVYKQKHDEIWPEMVEQMRREGIRTYSIYRHGLLLFAYLERDAPPNGDEPGSGSIVWRWWAHMAPHMETNPDTSPVMESVEEVFHFPAES